MKPLKSEETADDARCKKLRRVVGADDEATGVEVQVLGQVNQALLSCSSGGWMRGPSHEHDEESSLCSDVFRSIFTELFEALAPDTKDVRRVKAAGENRVWLPPVFGLEPEREIRARESVSEVL